ncbi:MAG: Protein FecR [Stenotrophomonas maltophilia]|uniref:Protein FecR n=1 Tax=Stenotrophomonas maltophilia TaxID=40324 RepID=A0A7V8FJ16_STEMA|nr:MAG: Protein FecR [Stenotrophomonas maltophilia]
MTTSEPSPRQARQALRWVIRCSNGPLPPRRHAALQRWLRADPCHRQAWQQQAAFWNRLDAAGPDVLAALPALTADTQGLRPLRPVRMGRWLAVAAAAVLMVATAPQALLLARSDFRTGSAPRSVVLADGSQLVLDAGSVLAVNLDGNARTLRLLRGRAWFQVQHEARPFVVDVGGGRVRDIGTAFSVELQPAGVRTAVSEGAVDVMPGSDPAVQLRAGQARVFRDGRWQGALASSAVEGVAPWRRGEVGIDDLPAAEAIAELARYRRAPVWVLGGRKGAVRVSGLFHTAQPERAIEAVATQAGLQVQALPGGVLLLR